MDRQITNSGTYHGTWGKLFNSSVLQFHNNKIASLVTNIGNKLGCFEASV